MARSGLGLHEKLPTRPALPERGVASALRHLGCIVAFVAGVVFMAPPVLAQDDWGVERDDLQARKIERYKKLVNRSDEEGYAFKQLMKTVGRGPAYDKLIEEYRAKVEAEPDNYRWRMLLGHMLRYGNNLEAALAEYEAASEIKETARVWESIARVHDANKAMQKAVTAYEKALELATKKDQKERILRALGSMAIHRRKIEEAKKYFARLVELDPKNIFLRRELSQLLIENKLYDEALEQLKAARKLAGRNVQVRTQIMLDIGEVLEKQGKDDEAIEMYRDAASKVASDNWLRTAVEERIVGIYRRQNRLHELVAYYEENWRSPNFDQLMILSRLYGELGDDGKALEYVRKAIRKRPRDADARQRLVQLLERTGDIEKVIAAYEDMIDALPREPRYRFELADLLFRAQKKDEAIKVLERAGRAFPRNADVHSKLADRYMNWDMRDEALDEYKLLVRIEPDDPAHLENLGEFHWQAGDREKAIDIWKKVLSVIDNPAEARMYLGRIYGDHGMLDESIAEYLTAREKAPDNLQVMRELGEVYERARRFNDAIDTWEKLLELSEDKMMRREARQHIINIYHQQQTLRANLRQYERRFERTPPDIEAGFFLAEAHLKLKDIEAATEVLEKILEARPDDIEALMALEKGYSDLGEYEKAIAVLEKLAEVDEARARVYYQQIADAYLKIGDPDSAEEWMEAAININANDSRSYAKLGDVYRKKRQFEKAAEMYEEAINVDPRAYDHYFVLADIYGQLQKDREADKLYRIVVNNAIDETMILKAARRTIDFNQFEGTLDDLEQGLLPLLHKTPRRPAYNRILLELYRAMTQEPIARARSGSPKERAAAREELEAIGRRAIKPLLDAMNEEDAVTQLIALDLLGEIGNPNAALQLALLLENPNPKMSMRAALALGRIGGERVVEPLSKATEPQFDRRIQELATWGLGRSGSKAAIPVLQGLAQHNLQSVRTLAAIGLGRVGGGEETLRRMLRHEANDSARAAAAWAVGRLGDAESVGLLTDMLREERERVAAMAAWSLGALGRQSTVEPLLDAYWGSTPMVREAAGYALVRLASDAELPDNLFSLWEENAAFIDVNGTDGAPFDYHGLLDEILAVETRALEGDGALVADRYPEQLQTALGRWLGADDGGRIATVLRDLDSTTGSLALPPVSAGGPMVDIARGVAPKLRALLDASVARHRWHAASVLGHVGDEDSVAKLVALLENDQDNDVRRQAALALGQIGQKAAYAPLVEHLKDEYFGVRAHAALGLGHLGDTRAYDALVGLLDDEYSYVAGMAARALGLLGDERAVRELEQRFGAAPVSVKAAIVRSLATLGQDVSHFGDSPHAAVRRAVHEAGTSTAP